jgi:hypothetical protein
MSGVTLEYLRQAENLVVIEIDFIYGDYEEPGDAPDERQEAWKRDFVDVLKNSPSQDRKFLRWRTTRGEWQRYDVVASGELEVFPGTSL